ncbi:ester cyclase [Methanococcoides sp. AM1]|uniref:ester cyclase n=1 Tax=Methanococcoides sp. AM1 TaxID=1201011 RepID=UPI001FCE6698|nr:ester cyclase [Methanococcoides sp. AM1]
MMTTDIPENNASFDSHRIEEKNKEMVLGISDRGWHPKQLTDKCSPDYHMHFGGETLDLESLMDFMASIHKALPDLHFVINDVIAEGDKVVTRWTASGTHLADFQGVPPTHKPVTFTGITITRIEDGLIAEDWEEVDQLNFAQQFGAFSSDML